METVYSQSISYTHCQAPHANAKQKDFQRVFLPQRSAN